MEEQLTKKKSKLWIWIVIVIVIILLGIAAYFIFNLGKSSLDKALEKKDLITGKSAIELIETADFEGMERAGLTGEDTKLIVEAGLVDMEKAEAALEEETQNIIDEGKKQLELAEANR